MSQTLTLPDELYVRLAKGAAQRGLTIESLLAFVSEIVLLPSRPTARDRQRSECIERLFREIPRRRIDGAGSSRTESTH